MITNNKDEKWAVVEEFPRYKVSNTGKVYSSHSKRLLTPTDNGAGYLTVMVIKDRKQYRRHIHRLVAKAHVPGYRDGTVVDHVDGNKSNNNASNLEWVTTRENCIRGSQCNRNKNKKSKYPGVRYFKSTDSWGVNIRYKKKRYFIMHSKDEELCSIVYQEAVKAIDNGVFEDFMSELAEAKKNGAFIAQ